MNEYVSKCECVGVCAWVRVCARVRVCECARSPSMFPVVARRAPLRKAYMIRYRGLSKTQQKPSQNGPIFQDLLVRAGSTRCVCKNNGRETHPEGHSPSPRSSKSKVSHPFFCTRFRIRFFDGVPGGAPCLTSLGVPEIPEPPAILPRFP